ncbi:MAG: hypothetical protein J6V68_00915 [Clostridia bacterium]|nr:hypothetical protein [Clostridia bacterium]
MKNFALNLFLDTLFCFFACFFLLLTVLSYYLSHFFTLFISIFLSLFVSALVFLKLKNKRLLNTLTKKENALKFSVINNFCLLNENQQIDELKKALTISENTLYTTKNSVTINDDFILKVKFGFYTLTPADISEVYKKIKSKTKKIALFCYKYSPDAEKLAQKLGVTLIDESKTFALFKKANYYPEIKIDFNEEKLSFKQIFNSLLVKKNAKNYLFSAIMIFLLSFLSPLKFYYVLFGSFLTILAILSKFYGQEKPKNA